MPNKLVDIQLWDANRTASITLPQEFDNACTGYNQPTVRQILGRPSEMTIVLNPHSELATGSTSDAWHLRKKKILRLIYDDNKFQEWRIKRTTRQTSGKQGFEIVGEPLVRDLAYTNIRKVLVTGDVVMNLSFYGETLNSVLTSILTANYNCPDLFIKGDVTAGVISQEIRASFNGANFNQVLNELASQANAEWNIVWNDIDDNYLVNFYELGESAGGQTEAPNRVIGMGGTYGNRNSLQVKSSEEDFFSRIIGVAGQGTETIGIAGIQLTPTSIYGTTYTIDEDLILESDFLVGYSETVYFGNEADGWEQVTATVAPNQITLDSANTFTQKCRFALGSSKKKLIYLESPDAVSDFGINEFTYRRTDIGAAENLIAKAGVTPDMSTFVSGVPKGTVKVGSPTVTEETSDEFVKFGSKSAKVVADTGEGLEFELDLETDYPYFSLLTYLYVGAGNVKVEFEDSNNSLVPEGQFAETNSSNVQGLSLSGAQPASGTATVRVLALEDATTFYIDGWTLCNTSTSQPLLPFMGAIDLWKEMGNNLLQFGGNQPNEYVGECWDDAYFNDSAKEITIGSWVTVKDGWNGTDYEIDFEGRVLELNYVDEFKKGRLKKRGIKISNRKQDLEQFLNSMYVTRSETQENQDVPIVPSLDALSLAIKEGNIVINREGAVLVNLLQIGTFDNNINYNSGTAVWGFVTDGSDIRFSTNGANVEFLDTDVKISRVGFYGASALSSKPTVIGSRGGNAALQSLVTALENFGLITDSTT